MGIPSTFSLSRILIHFLIYTAAVLITNWKVINMVVIGSNNDDWINKIDFSFFLLEIDKNLYHKCVLASSLEFRIVIIITITGLQNVQPNFYIFFAFSCIIKLNFEELNTDIIRTQCTVFDKHNQIK
jgi:hypothetical protein